MIKSLRHNFVHIIVRISIYLHIGIATYRPLSIDGKDILGSYSAITVDGFDFILTGRAIASGVIVDLPVLRNPLFTLISAIDYLIGGIGIAFAFTIGLSLILQYVAISKLMKFYGLSKSISTSILVIFFFNPIHFLDLYILSDSFSLSIMMFGIATLIIKKNNTSEITGVLLIIISALGQFYTLFGLLFFFINNRIQGMTLLNYMKQFLKNKNIYLTAILLAFYLLIRKSWTTLIDHQSVPNNFSLLEVSFKMFNFYLNTWIVLFIPFIIVILGVTFTQSQTLVYFIKTKFFDSGFIISLFLAILLFFYQWKESRFSYLLVIFIIINLILFFYNIKITRSIEIYVIFIAILTLVFSVLWSPKDNWQPRVGETRFFRPWITERYWERVPFSYYVELRDQYCSDRNLSTISEKLPEVSDEFVKEMPTPVRDMSKFGIGNCL
jgi:hypothetical protein